MSDKENVIEGEPPTFKEVIMGMPPEALDRKVVAGIFITCKEDGTTSISRFNVSEAGMFNCFRQLLKDELVSEDPTKDETISKN